MSKVPEPKPPYLTYLMDGLSGKTSEASSEIRVRAAIVWEDHNWDESDLNLSPYFPLRYSSHPDRKLAKAGFRVVDVDWERDKRLPQVTNLNILYSNKISDQQQIRNKEIEYEPDPTKRPPTITWGTYTTMEGQDLAYENPEDNIKPLVPIQTTAMEPILFKRAFKRRAITITFNSPVLPDWFMEDYDVVNSDAIKLPNSPLVNKKFFKFPKNSLLLYDATATTEQLENDYRYFKITVVLHHKKEGWHFKPRNVGRQAYSILTRYNETLDKNEFVRSKSPSLIRIGSPVPELPLNPLPLRNTPKDLSTHGILFNDYINYDPETGLITYDQDPVTPERLREIYEEATLDFAVYREVPFISLISGIAFFNK